MVVIGVVPVTLGGEAFAGCTEIFKQSVIVYCKLEAAISVLLGFFWLNLSGSSLQWSKKFERSSIVFQMILTATVLVGKGNVIQCYVPTIALSPSAFKHDLIVLCGGDGSLAILPLRALLHF